MSDLRKIIIDDQEIEVEGAMTLIQACEQVGVEVPRFCYHERLTIAGNCRMCLVEVVGGPPKPAASCATKCSVVPNAIGPLGEHTDGSHHSHRTFSSQVRIHSAHDGLSGDVGQLNCVPTIAQGRVT